MGLLFPEDPHFDETKRQTGFYRYRQLLSIRFGQWWRANLLTLAGFIPLAAGVFFAVASSSVLVLLPCSFLGVYSFMAMLFWWAEVSPSPGTVALYLFALLAVLILNTLYWPQLVLFRQKTSVRLNNCLLFCVKYFPRVLGVGLLQLGYWTVFVLFAPWTLLLLPILGVWYILFLSQFLIYEQMDGAYGIEAGCGEAGQV